jgi:hypothetical protein
MRLHKLVVVITLVALAAPMTALAGEATRIKRFHGSDSGTFVIAPTSNPDVVFSEDVTTGKANKGIGRYTVVASEFVNLATFEITGGVWTISSRKGTLVGSYAGAASPTPDPAVITYHVTGPITGGTGRFAGASGTIVFDGIANLATGELSEKVSAVLIMRGARDEDDD